MKINKKYIIAGAIAGGLYLGYRYIENTKKKLINIFTNVSYIIEKISRFDVSTKRIQIIADIGLQNNTNIATNLSSNGFAKVQQILVHDKLGELVSTIDLQLENFVIKQYGKTIIKDVVIEIPFLKALKMYSNTDFSNMSADKFMAGLDFSMVIIFLGKQKIIKLER